MLTGLGGREHRVVSGLCLLGGDFEIAEHDVTTVRFRSLTREEIDAYVATGEWEGRAGAYAIQGQGRSARRAYRGRLPERRRLAGGLARAHPRRALPRSLRLRSRAPNRMKYCAGLLSVRRSTRELGEGPRRPVYTLRTSCGHPEPPRRPLRPRHGSRPRHREHARLRARARHRPLRAVRGRDRPALRARCTPSASKRSACSGARRARSRPSGRSRTA